MSARLVTRGLLGVVLGSAAVVIAALEIYHLVRTGSCASGGPYVSARPCPSGTGGRIFALIGAIFVLGPLSTFVFASRAKGIRGLPGAGALVGLLWTCGWIAMGSAAWVAGHGPARPSSGGEGSTSVAITFWGIGGVSAIFVLLGFFGARRTVGLTARAGATFRSTPPPAPAVPTTGVASTGARLQQLAATLDATAQRRAAEPGVSDVARRLKQLDELKAMGAVTAAEYAAKRREILGDI